MFVIVVDLKDFLCIVVRGTGGAPPPPPQNLLGYSPVGTCRASSWRM
jgi:hypothetical protein